MKDKDRDPVKPFHDHLEQCHQCESQPFNLCSEGARLIQQAVDFSNGKQMRAITDLTEN